MKKIIAAAAALIMALTVCGQSIGAEQYTADTPVKTVSIDLDKQLGAAKTKKASPPATIKNITNETVIEYKSIKEDFRKEGYGTPALYNFTNQIATGRAADGSVISCETNYYGLKSYIDKDGKIKIRGYNNTNKKLSITSASVESIDRSKGKIIKVKNPTFKYGTIDTRKYSNGLYRINATFSTKETFHIYFYMNDGKAYLCDIAAGSRKTYIAKRREELNKALKTAKTTPENSITLDGVCYPFKAFNSNYRCDTDRWADLSKTIVEDDWSDSRKVYAFCEWIAKNIAYDWFKVNSTGNKSRAQYYEDYSGKQSVYDLRTGVCFDNANILTIMCRANNIPAVTVGSKELNHVWNGIYINDRWYEIDLVPVQEYGTSTADSTKRIKKSTSTYDSLFYVFTRKFEHYTPEDLEINIQFQKDSNKVY